GRHARSVRETRRQRALHLWPYLLAGAVSWIGVSAAGLPGALGLLPVIPAIPHSERTFGLFAEAEELLHDPLNRIAHLMVPAMTLVLFLFGLTRGGIDPAALAPTTFAALAAFWIGKPLGLLAGAALAQRLPGVALPEGIRPADLARIALIAGLGFTVPLIAIDSALPGGAMAEAARLGIALSLLIAPAALLLARR
ncbi:MAG: Na+/H+ antiporter NhaA, partial [Gemmobacter sp.]